VVSADPYRVLFALDSMLAYLLRSRANAEPIVITVRQLSGGTEVSMCGAVQQGQPLGGLAALVETTRTPNRPGRGRARPDRQGLRRRFRASATGQRSRTAFAIIGRGDLIGGAGTLTNIYIRICWYYNLFPPRKICAENSRNLHFCQ
jgi:hypothetical protein